MGKGANVRNAVAAIELYCRKSNGRALKRLGSCIGASIGKNKSEGRESIVEQAVKLEKLRQRRFRDGEASVAAIDTGVSNFAYSVFKWYKGDEVPTLVGWNKINLCQKFLGKHRLKMAMDPKDTWQVGRGLLEMFTNEMAVSDLYVVEKQRTRSFSSKNVLESVLLSNVVEHILFSNLRNKQIYGNANTDYIVDSSNPQRMAQYWCDLKSLKTLHFRFAQSMGLKSRKDLRIDDKDTVLATKVNKTIRINLVKTILKNAIEPQDYKMCNLTPRWKSKVERQLNTGKKFRLLDCIGSGPELGTRKDDDLADSFLHGLAWMRWLRNYEGVAEIITGNGGSFDRNVLAEFNEYCMSLDTEWTLMSPEMKGKLAELNLTNDSATPDFEEDLESIKAIKRDSKL
ncbi:hypothetical protein ZYGR_0AL00230 [Zygosaccharomyces rouxii]|uniref:Mitochondrial resolvase Ydc2 catalytic domain-containing protein n=1 Tax=Zygosaccharomyces rouxii TaxID=4956 RepID=A0A1Q3AF43_ZYGRO|nr:hypothetical protein ZYGR_0AL00230 [Zygosaccharomyces rouxii]